MKELGLLALLVLLGPGFLWMGIRSLRTRAWHDGVPALELMIDRVIGEEPPPRTKWDRRFALFQTGAAILFGSFFTLIFLAVLYVLISEQ
ncbi:MAG: hypothetical protein Q27BB25_06290 [Blastomonas sp. CACIA14H2]|uniref:hypothetical protein n=1 Tax=Blastomonas sp. CACIA14H2 TaxID=1419876 RepID=UPI0003CFD4B9|nr:MAG: hypothetical protein Q27BB25_06290 [Blastomonas sp. CACIA14H2]